jgi:hypothetical protein
VPVHARLGHHRRARRSMPALDVKVEQPFLPPSLLPPSPLPFLYGHPDRGEKEEGGREGGRGGMYQEEEK